MDKCNRVSLSTPYILYMYAYTCIRVEFLCAQLMVWPQIINGGIRDESSSYRELNAYPDDRKM